MFQLFETASASEKRVLVISDDERLGKITQHLLKQSGLQVKNYVIKSPHHIRNWNGNGTKFDLLVLAMSLDQHDPLLWVNSCPAINHIRHIPWLVISNRPFADDMERQIAHLHFPFDVIDFWRKVEELLNPGSNGIGILRFLDKGWQSEHTQEQPILKKSLLVASTDDHLRHELSQRLNQYDNLEVIAQARSSLEAGIKALTLAPDLIILDENMPRLHAKIIDWIRERVPESILILVSIHSETDTPISSSQLENNFFCLSGVNQVDLIQKICTMISRDEGEKLSVSKDCSE